MTVDDLSLVVEHMKKSNGFVKTTNIELGRFNSNQGTQNRWLSVISILLTVLVIALGYSLWMAKQALDKAQEQTAALEKTNTRLDAMLEAQKDTQKTAEDTKKAVEEQPTITVKPADTTDPSSKPVLVVQPKPKTPKPKGKKSEPKPKAPSKPTGVEIPLDIPKKK